MKAFSWSLPSFLGVSVKSKSVYNFPWCPLLYNEKWNALLLRAMCQFILGNFSKKCSSWILLSDFQGSPSCWGNSGHWGFLQGVELPYPIWPCPKGPFQMEDIYYLKGNGSKCFHEQSKNGAIDLPKRDETTYRPDLRLIGTGTPWTRMREPYF